MVDKEMYREEIVIVSSRIFSKYGYRKSTMEEIARALGKGKSSIYYYFKSKEEIFEAVIDREVQILRDELTKAIKSTDDPGQRLRLYVTVRMRAFEKLSNYYKAIFNPDFDHFDFIDKQRQKYDHLEIALLRYMLWLGVKSGHYQISDTGLTALAVQTALKGLERPLFWERQRGGLEKRLEALTDLLFYGIVRGSRPTEDGI